MTKMKTQNLNKVFFLTVVSMLAVVACVSAGTSDIATIDSVKINDILDTGSEDISVVAGETVTIDVLFTAIESASDVRVKAELEGVKVDVDAVTTSFTIEDGKRYSKTLTLRVPYELEDAVSEDMALNLKVWNGDFKTEHPEITLRTQRPSYNADVMSISASQSVEAGELYPVDIVLKNIGYNKLNDVYVTAKISALGIERTAYFGDLVSLQDKHFDDTESRRIYLEIPYDVENGVYTLEVTASNEDTTVTEAKQIAIENDFSSSVIVPQERKLVGVKEDAEFELVIANPTNKLKVYRVVTESSGDLTASSNAEIVSIPAGLTKAIKVTANADKKGEYDFNVNIFSGEELVETVTLGVSADGKSTTSSVVALTIILAVIFLVLLSVLVILLRKRSNKEEFGESYY